MKVLVRLILFCTVQGMTPSVHIRAFTADDVPAIASIYSHHVLTGTATFEEIRRMKVRWQRVCPVL